MPSTVFCWIHGSCELSAAALWGKMLAASDAHLLRKT
jgi:hypothetical protein